MKPPEDEQPLDRMTGDELRDRSLQRGFVLDNSLTGPGLVAGDEFPWRDVDASRRDRRLQGKHPGTEGKEHYLACAQACPKCRTPAESLSWFYFDSPKETWAGLCGVAGWLTVCDPCRVQVNFFDEVMS